MLESCVTYATQEKPRKPRQQPFAEMGRRWTSADRKKNPDRAARTGL